MISKDTIANKLMEHFIVLASGGIGLQVMLAGHNFIHALIGVAGQCFYIMMEYIRAEKAGKEVKKRSAWFWLSCVLLGAFVSFMGTPWTSNKLGLNELVTGVGLGFFAQALPEVYDLAVELIKNFIKKWADKQ